MQPISDVNIAAAALTAQFVLILIVFVATRFVEIEGDEGAVMSIVGGVALIAAAALLFTNQLASLWRPLLPDAHVGLSLKLAFLIAFAADMLLALLLVLATGDSISSPFTPIYFLIPVLALFLRESRARVLAYAGVIVILYTITLIVRTPSTPRLLPSRVAHWIVAISAFALATFIGLYTTPR